MEASRFIGLAHIDVLDFSTQFRIAEVGEHAAMILLMLFSQQFQQSFLKAAALLGGVKQSHSLI